MERAEPISALINMALDHVRSEDPNWDHYQPKAFRASVVDRWKKLVRVTSWHTSLRWSLLLGKYRFDYVAPMFTLPNYQYNPYRSCKSSRSPG